MCSETDSEILQKRERMGVGWGCHICWFSLHFYFDAANEANDPRPWKTAVLPWWAKRPVVKFHFLGLDGISATNCILWFKPTREHRPPLLFCCTHDFCSTAHTLTKRGVKPPFRGGTQNPISWIRKQNGQDTKLQYPMLNSRNASVRRTSVTDGFRHLCMIETACKREESDNSEAHRRSLQTNLLEFKIESPKRQLRQDSDHSSARPPEHPCFGLAACLPGVVEVWEELLTCYWGLGYCSFIGGTHRGVSHLLDTEPCGAIEEWIGWRGSKSCGIGSGHHRIVCGHFVQGGFEDWAWCSLFISGHHPLESLRY